MTRPPVGSTGTLAELQVEPGDVVVMHDDKEQECFTCLNAPPRSVGCFDDHWEFDGALFRDGIFRLISRANPDQPAHIITHEGRQYDLTALETPFGLLPEPVQEALQAWPHGIETFTAKTFTASGWAVKHPSWLHTVSYRAIPAPTENRVQCYRGEYYKRKEHGTCIKNPDGSIDWASWEDAE